jgi:hypothetical protein
VGDGYTAGSVKNWVCEDESDEIYPSCFAETRRRPSDIAKAISKLLNKRPLISRQDITELPKLMRTLTGVFEKWMRRLQLCVDPRGEYVG